MTTAGVFVVRAARLQLYGTFQLIQAVLSVSMACGMVGVHAGQELLCGCIASLATVGACCMLIPNIVVLVSPPWSCHARPHLTARRDLETD
jgi:hypothetical protein